MEHLRCRGNKKPANLPGSIIPTFNILLSTSETTCVLVELIGRFT